MPGDDPRAELIAMLRATGARERRERIATAVYAAMRPGVIESVGGARRMDFAELARIAVEAADALIMVLDAGKEPTP